MSKRLPIYADIPLDLKEADELLHRYGRWALDRYSPGTCGSAERMYRPERGEQVLEARREPREVLMPAAEAVNVQRALIRVPEMERIVLQYLYVPQRWPAHVMLAKAKIPPRLSRERHLAGLRMFHNIHKRIATSAILRAI
jgi:hypothetical protein